MDFRYGIHTIELFHRVSKKDFNKVFHSLKSLNSGSFYPDTTYHSEKGLTKYICTSYCGQGVVLYLYQQVRSKNKIKKNHAPFIHFRLNPHTLLHGEYSPKKVFQAKEKQLKSLDNRMTGLLREIGLDCEFEQLTLSRIDCCLDFSPDTQEWVNEALRVVRRSPYMKQYKLCTFGKGFPNHKEKNAHSWRIYCKTTTLTVYDKTFQLMEEELLENYDAPMLRFEVSRSGAKFKRGLSDEVKGSNKEILKTVMNESEKTIHSYMKKLHANLPFVRYSDCIMRIETVKHSATRKNMQLLVEKLSDCKSYAQAVKNSGLSENKLRTVRKQFEKLGVQPVTMRDTAEIEELKILTVKETAALLKTTRQQVRKMIVNEELPAVKVGREWRVLKAGIVEFFEKQICY